MKSGRKMSFNKKTGIPNSESIISTTDSKANSPDSSMIRICISNSRNWHRSSLKMLSRQWCLMAWTISCCREYWMPSQIWERLRWITMVWGKCRKSMKRRWTDSWKTNKDWWGWNSRENWTSVTTKSRSWSKPYRRNNMLVQLEETRFWMF